MESKDMEEVEAQTYNFSFVGGNLALDFTNTVGAYKGDERHDHFETYEDVVRWGRQAEVLSAESAARLEELARKQPDEAARVLARTQAVRYAIHYLFEAVSAGSDPGEEDLETLNSELAHSMQHGRIEHHGDHYAWGWNGLGEELDSMLWPPVRAAADLLLSEERKRVSLCAGDTCGWLFIDMSRNRSRHWCDMRDCGNRAKARRHYKRKQAASTTV
jgi:predicted RNA-binding Zn ribbon-like protein